MAVTGTMMIAAAKNLVINNFKERERRILLWQDGYLVEQLV